MTQRSFALVKREREREVTFEKQRKINSIGAGFSRTEKEKYYSDHISSNNSVTTRRAAEWLVGACRLIGGLNPIVVSLKFIQMTDLAAVRMPCT